MPLYRAVINCTDFDGRFFRKGEEVDLPEGKHSDWLVLLAENPETEDENPGTRDENPETGDENPGTGDENPGTGDENPETGDENQGKHTEETLKPLTKAQLVDLALKEYGLELSVKSKETELISAILVAQERWVADMKGLEPVSE